MQIALTCRGRKVKRKCPLGSFNPFLFSFSRALRTLNDKDYKCFTAFPSDRRFFFPRLSLSYYSGCFFLDTKVSCYQHCVAASELQVRHILPKYILFRCPVLAPEKHYSQKAQLLPSFPLYLLNFYFYFFFQFRKAVQMAPQWALISSA